MTAKTRPFGMLKGGIEMPQLGLGVWQVPQTDVAAIVKQAIDEGYCAVDTAAIYENEAGVGDGLAGHENIFLTTKLWNTEQGYDEALAAFEISARKLGREVIDLYLIHWPSPSRDRYVESWKALVRLKEEGRVRAIGVSNFAPDHLQRIIDATGEIPAVNQIELHPRFQQRELRAFHESHGIVTQSWSPLGQGTLLADSVLAEIATRHGKTTAQIIIRWHIDSGLIVIPKTVRIERLRENIDVFDFQLDEAEMQAISGLDETSGRIGPDPQSATF